MVVVYSEGVQSEIDGMMTQFPKICTKYDKQSFLFNEYLFKGKRKSHFHYQTLDKECPQSILFSIKSNMMLQHFRNEN
jgi:hypothetical protein